MPYSIGSNTIITEGDASPASANASFRNFFYRYSLNPATYVGTVGTNYGYIAGGTSATPTGTIGAGSPGVYYNFPLYNGSPGLFINNVERFPFASSINTVQVSGGLSTARAAFASQSSKTAGYSSGGFVGIPVPLAPTTPANNLFSNITASSVIDSFPFISMGIITVSSAGSLSTGRLGGSGQQSDTAGFTAGGSTSNTTQVATIDNFPFSTFTTATSVGNLSANNTAMAGHSSATSGYTSAGYSAINLAAAGAVPYGTALTTINRYPFSVSPVTASSVANLVTARGYLSGGSSPTFGYTFGGAGSNPGNVYNNGPGVTTNIERFSFSEQTVTVSAVPAVLTSARVGFSVVSSSDFIYVCGGYTNTPQQFSYPFPPFNINLNPSGTIATIDRFPFASTTVAASTTNLTTAKGHTGGNQY